MHYLFMKNKLSGILLTLFLLAGAGCSSNSTEQKTGESATGTSGTETTGAAADSTQQMAYICPMECAGSASHEPGKCPVCGMDLVKNPNYKEAAADSAAQKVN